MLLIFQRLKSFPIREQVSEDDKIDEPLIFTGAIYGIQVDAISPQVRKKSTHTNIYLPSNALVSL